MSNICLKHQIHNFENTLFIRKNTKKHLFLKIDLRKNVILCLFVWYYSYLTYFNNTDCLGSLAGITSFLDITNKYKKGVEIHIGRSNPGREWPPIQPPRIKRWYSICITGTDDDDERRRTTTDDDGWTTTTAFGEPGGLGGMGAWWLEY